MRDDSIVASDFLFKLWWNEAQSRICGPLSSAQMATPPSPRPQMQTKEALEVNQQVKKFGCSTLDAIPSSSTVLRIPFEARPIHGETALAFCWLFTVKRIQEKKEDEEEGKKKYTAETTAARQRKRRQTFTLLLAHEKPVWRWAWKCTMLHVRRSSANGERSCGRKSIDRSVWDFTNSFSHHFKFAKRCSELSVTPLHWTCNQPHDILCLFSPMRTVCCTNHIGVMKPQYIFKAILVNSCDVVKAAKACMSKWKKNTKWRMLRLTPSRLEKRLRQTFRLELVSLDSSQISCIFCNKGDGNPERTNKWISVHLHSGLKPIQSAEVINLSCLRCFSAMLRLILQILIIKFLMVALIIHKYWITFVHNLQIIWGGFSVRGIYFIMIMKLFLSPINQK